MRLSEITYPRNDIKTQVGVPNIDHRISDDYMMSLGFKPIGNESTFASLYSHPKLSYVLKVFSEDDYCYQNFYYIAMKYPNPHFPKFVGKMMRLSNQYYAVRIERLTERPVSTLPNGITEKQIYMYIDPEFQSDDLDEIMTKSYPDLNKALQIIESIADNCRNDIHDENIMFRGNIPVIIDPWAPNDID